ncbi:hypothetical protein LPJ61_000383 [Coemansia biformis]|uniref:DUF7137 domain-containing protein n=1 Tax=Coemansia biformis TaxID=1286918 RepID=A0A9W7YIE9_9FUNG|nr:hypothetical protein LPJ61_000383 [Coemansia biformis]
MRLQAVLCVVLASVAVAADARSDLLRGFNLAVAGPAGVQQQAQGANTQQAQAPGAQARGGGPAQADKDKGAHVGARPQEAPRHDAKAPPPSSTAKGGAVGNGAGDRGARGSAKHDADDDAGGRKLGDHRSPTKTHKDVDEDDDDGDDGDSEMERRYMDRIKSDKAAGRQPGRMKMVVPPRTVHTPLFELDSVIELQWEYDKNVVEVPEKLMISVQLPKDPHAEGGSKPVLYDIAVNITGKQSRFFWDTKNDIPEGIGMREGNGYTMFFYDGDIGFRMSDVVPAGYLIKYAMPFAFFSSRYEHTNDGVPRNYNPNAAARPAPALLQTAALLLAAAVALHARS